MSILGLHHITLVTANAQRTVDFYTELLGLRLVKTTVNFDDPSSYHLYFGDDIGRPGTVITWFEWKGAARGLPGIGGTHHFALRVPDRSALLQWKRRLTDHGLSVAGPLDRTYFTSLYFRDPDGQVVELATDGPGLLVDEAPDRLGTTFQTPPEQAQKGGRDEQAIATEQWPEPVPVITPEMDLGAGLHHISAISADIQRSADFYEGVLGLRRLKMTANYDDLSSAHWYWGVGDGQPGSVVTCFERDPNRTRRAVIGAGQTHHFALAVADDAELSGWRERLIRAGFAVSPVRDRQYFRSIYTKDPDGHIVELATVGPGFLVDEDFGSLGQSLRLPPQYESQRQTIESALGPLQSPRWNSAG